MALKRENAHAVVSQTLDDLERITRMRPWHRVLGSKRHFRNLRPRRRSRISRQKQMIYAKRIRVAEHRSDVIETTNVVRNQEKHYSVRTINRKIMKVGFVTIFGRSNVGKSTLLNRLVGTKLAITSPKPQTTRHHIQGVVHDPRGQIVFVDTPGIFTSSRDKLSRSLNASAEAALKDVDVIVHVVDPTRAIGPEDKRIFSILDQLDIPKILVINKMDVHRPPYLLFFEQEATRYKAVVKLSGKTGAHTKTLVNTIFDFLHEGQPLYAEGQITNMDQKVWFAELIREKLFLRLRDEVPYSLTVVVDDINERDNGVLYIEARILIASERYKRIVIGQGGRGIKEIGQSARRELEQVTGGSVYLDLTVETDPHWMQAFG